MLRYKINVLSALKEKGYSTYRLSKEKIFSNGSIQKLHDNEVLGKSGLEMLCTLLQCDISDILEFVPDTQSE